MTPTNLCRLCVEICPSSQSLYDENGRGNELYDITCKYFHPKIVDMQEAKHLKAICVQCWRCMHDFHRFQLSVLVAQMKLNNVGVEQSQAIIIKSEIDEPIIEATDDGGNLDKGEEELLLKPLTKQVWRDDNQPHTTEVCLPSVLSADAELQDFEERDTKMFLTQPELEIVDVMPDGDFSLDDETPSAQTALQPTTVDLSSAAEEQVSPTDFESIDIEVLMAKWLPNIECPYCRDSFRQLCSFEDHFLQMHSNKDFYITCCSRAFRNRDALKDHLILHDDPNAFRCAICDNSFTTRITFHKHMAVQHRKDKRTKNKPQRNVVRRRTRAQVQEEDNVSRYTCDECGKVINSKAAYKYHKWYNHRHEPKHQCSVCLRKFKRAIEFREHVAVQHTGKDLYACAFCSMTFQKLYRVKQHRKRLHPQEEQTNYFRALYKRGRAREDSDSDAETKDKKEDMKEEVITSANSKC